MYRGTTPTLPVRIKGVDLTNTKIFLTFSSKMGKLLTLEYPGDFTVELDNGDTVCNVTFTQEQTLWFKPEAYFVQARWIDSNNIAGATKTKQLCIRDVLLKDVIYYD